MIGLKTAYDRWKSLGTTFEGSQVSLLSPQSWPRIRDAQTQQIIWVSSPLVVWITVTLIFYLVRVIYHGLRLKHTELIQNKIALFDWGLYSISLKFDVHLTCKGFFYGFINASRTLLFSDWFFHLCLLAKITVWYLHNLNNLFRLFKTQSPNSTIFKTSKLDLIKKKK